MHTASLIKKTVTLMERLDWGHHGPRISIIPSLSCVTSHKTSILKRFRRSLVSCPTWISNRKPVKMREQLKLEEQEEIAVGQVTVMKPNKV